MGRGQPTSRIPNYITDLEVLLQAKNEKIAELQFELSSYEESDANLQKKVKELEEKLAGKPAYHCPKCDSWFSEEALEQKDEPHK